MTNYIAYYRVSTLKQGISGLGLDAQRAAVYKFVNGCTSQIIKEFTDIESGKNNDRIELMRAIEETKKNNAQLLIAKLDRLSRNAAFIFTLRDSDVEFICADMPNANRVTIGIMAVLAQDERERISQRTKAALGELKKKGVKLGSPQNLDSSAMEKGRKVRMQNAFENDHNLRAEALIRSLRTQDLSFYLITQRLNTLGFLTRRGCKFTQTQVQRLFNRRSL